MTLDLHGTKHEDVRKILDSKLYECMKKKVSRLTVITGHSDEMRKLVREVAKDYNITAVTSLFSEAEMLLDLI